MLKIRTTSIDLSKSVLPEFLRLPTVLQGTDGVLRDKKIVLTRGQEQPSKQIESLLNEGAEVILFPAISLSEITIPANEKEKILNGFYSYIIFTSVPAVKYFFGQFSKNEIAYLETDTRFISIGIKTTESLQQYIKNIFYTNSGTTSADLLNNLHKILMSGDTVLLPCSSIAKTEILTGLTRDGIEAKQLFIYNTNLPDEQVSTPAVKYVKQNEIDCYIFTSPSAFNNFLQLMKIDDPSLYFDGKEVAAIGKTTQAAITKAGVRVNIVPKSPSIEEIAKEIINYYGLIKK